ncbi:MAG: hypothetical protein E7632_06060 [Ruminococcaceae bacterium]|nr:hypothetical protein [Oscillospiraceae bacterium]
MKKTYKLIDLDCAHCAAKMETAIKKLPGVIDASVLFLSQKLVLETEAEDQSAILKDVSKIIKKVEPDCELIF